VFPPSRRSSLVVRLSHSYKRDVTSVQRGLSSNLFRFFQVVSGSFFSERWQSSWEKPHFLAILGKGEIVPPNEGSVRGNAMADIPLPRTKRPRTIRLVRSPTGDGIGVFSVTVANRACYYTLYEIACEIGGRGFAVHRTGLGTLYHVRIGSARECSCECKGFLYRGSCRHVLGLLALIREGKL
jgi:SWIM zinc finger